MQNEIFEQFSTFNQNIFDTSKKFFEINAKASEKMLENQLKLTNTYIENSFKQMELVHDYKDAKSYMATQSEMAKQCADMAIAVNKDALAIATDTRTELKNWFEKGLEEAGNTVEETVKAAKKAA